MVEGLSGLHSASKTKNAPSLFGLSRLRGAGPKREGALFRYTILISISTPAGRFKFESDSMIFWLGFNISTRRL
jgi:hypothetical protein